MIFCDKATLRGLKMFSYLSTYNRALEGGDFGLISKLVKLARNFLFTLYWTIVLINSIIISNCSFIIEQQPYKVYP